MSTSDTLIVYCNVYGAVFPVLYFPGENIAHTENKAQFSAFMASYNKKVRIGATLHLAGKNLGYDTHIFTPSCTIT